VLDRDALAARLSVVCAALLPALLLARLPASLDGMDSANFALALAEYDPGLEQPHLPGYPLYVALCRLLLLAGLDEAAALALPGALAAAALAPSLLVIARRLLPDDAAVCLALPMLALHPLLLAEGARPLPDLLGASAAWSALALVASGRPAVAGLLLGVTLGVRVDLAPFALAGALLAPGGRRVFAVALAAGLALWLPLFVAVAPPELLARTRDFAGGHFTRWGSSALAGAGSMSALIWTALLASAGPVGVALCAHGWLRSPASLRRFLLWAVAPYAGWVLLGQNLAHPRHLLALVPALALLAGVALASQASARRRAALLALLVLSSLPVYGRALAPPLDGRALVARAVEACSDCAAVYAGEAVRLFDHYAPDGFPVYRRGDVEEIRLDFAAWDAPAGPVLATSEVAGASRLGSPIADVGRGMRLYRIDSTLLR